MEQLIKCVTVDDEAPALRLLEQYISQQPGLILAAQFQNPLNAANWLAAHKADILFLDINMPQQSGISLLQSLAHKPEVIFTTAYSEFAADAFDLDAADYLRKPFSFARFSKAIEKAIDNLQAARYAAAVSITNHNGENYLAIKANNGLVKVYFHEIVLVEGYQEYVKIYTANERYITYERMKNMEAMLPPSHFMRVHRSYIVALNHIRSITGNLAEIGEHQIPISRDLKDEVVKRIF